MSSDQLSQSRRGEQLQTSPRAVNQNRKATRASTAKKTYEAFDKRGKPSPYLEIRCVIHPSHPAQFRYLMDVVFTELDECFTLLYSFMAVEVKGRNLKEIRHAIQMGCCEYIQEYHDNEFLSLPQTEPMITSIRFITGDKLEDILSTYKR